MSRFPLGVSRPVEHGAALPGEADVVIIGGGVIGVMAAFYLAHHGMKPVLVEKGRVAAEQSGRNWGWIRQMGRDFAELPIMMEASQLWQQLEGEVGEDMGLARVGLTYFANSAKELAGFEEWCAGAREMGLDSRILSSAETARLIPGMAREWTGAMHTASDMRAEPWLAVPAMARAAVRAGAVIVENCAARLLDIEGGHVAGAVTEKGRIRADQVLVAGGAWSGLFLRRHGVNIPQLSVKATVVATDAAPDVHRGGAVGGRLAFRRRADGGYTLAPSGFHELWIGRDAFRALPKYIPQLMRDPFGRRYRPAAPKHYPDAWGTTRRWQGDEESPFERMRVLNPEAHPGKAAEVVERFQTLFPALGPLRVKASWAGMIDSMPDIVPVVDHGSAIPGLSICTGMCGHGFGIGPAFGRIMASLISGGEAGHDLGRFRLSRFSDGSKLELGPDL